jgi:ubiquinone/menaquinone biosynthesis C-methylase UbiE
VAHIKDPRHWQYFPSERFNQIYIEHIEGNVLLDQKVLEQFIRVLKKGGTLFYYTEKNRLPITLEDYSEKNIRGIKEALVQAGFSDVIARIYEKDTHPGFYYLSVIAEKKK